jgi:tetratricopeptide (TPR) repeat protein
MAAIHRLFSKAVSHHRAGRLHEAQTGYLQVLHKNDRHADALHLLGVVLSEAGRHDLAGALIRKAILVNGPTAEFCGNLGLVLAKQGSAPAAIACLRKALELDGSNAAWHYELANLLHRQSALDEAASHYEAAIDAHPDHIAAHFNLGVTRMMQSRLQEALSALERTLQLHPLHTEALNNLGIVLQAEGKLNEASELYDRARQIRPDYFDAHYNFALVCQELDRLEEAAQVYGELLSRRPSHAEAHNNLGNVQLALGNSKQARVCYQQAVRYNPLHHDANWNLGLADLLHGDFATGWAGYEWRLQGAAAATLPISGQRVLLCAEQGLGDTIQFLRYAPMVKALGTHVTLQCASELTQLASSARGIDQVIAAADAAKYRQDFDCKLPLLSLPRLFATTTVDRIPATVPYLSPDPKLVALWRKRLGPAGFRVGLAWAGNPLHRNDRNRSIPLEVLGDLVQTPGVRFFSLQKGGTLPGAESLGPALSNFAETAAAAANLDLIVSVDTSVAHLAGALHRPAWVLLPFAPDWRWMLNRNDSPWYPGMRLFRQTRRKEWKPVLDQVRSELEKLVSQHSSRSEAV